MAEESSKKSGFPRWLIVLGIVLVVLIGGISVSGLIAAKIAKNLVQKVVQEKTGAKVDYNQDSGSFKLEGEDTKIEVGSTASWPNNMPQDVTKPNFGIIATSFKTTDDQTNVWALIYKNVTKDGMDSYIENLKGSGWEEEATAQTVIIMNILKKNNLTLNLAFDPSSNGLNFTVTQKVSD